MTNHRMMFRVPLAIGCLTLGLSACASQDGAANELIPNIHTTVQVASTAPPPRHGVWVYGVRDLLQPGADAQRDDFVEFMLRSDINDVYLSIFDNGGSVLAEPLLPPLLHRLYENGIRVEALMGDPGWGIDPSEDGGTRRRSMLQHIDDMNAYNTGTSDVTQRFRGAHLDIEPWLVPGHTGEDLTWVDALIDAYDDAAQELASAHLSPGMTLVADVSGAKIQHAMLPQRQRMLDSVTRLVLMQYDRSDLKPVETQTGQFLQNLTISGDNHGVIVAIRVSDFPPPVTSTAAQLQSELLGTTGYQGWAIFDYEHARAQ
jgi:hypothetical protein